MKKISIENVLLFFAKNNKIFLTDRFFLKLLYKKYLGKELNLENPETFNEKLQWLKLYDRKDIYTKMVDKYEVKKYVADSIGEEYIIPTLGIFEKFEDIDFEKLPNQFVLKCTHDSGGIVICKNKETFNKKEAKKKLNEHLKINYYYMGREWPYKNVQPRIIAEKYMVDESGEELKDYKVFNFNGKSKLIEVDFSRFINHKRNIYDTNWNFIEKLEINYPNDSQRNINRPKKLEEMLQLAEKLSKGIPFLRTDFYVINGKIYFGELTFYHGSGLEKFEPAEYDKILGDMLELPKVKQEKDQHEK